MINKKPILIALILIMSLFISNVSAETKLVGTDDLNDVFDEMTGLNVTYPNIDIKKVTIDREGNKIDAILELNDEAEKPTSGIFWYIIYLRTTKNEYAINFGNYEDFNDTEGTASVISTSFEDILDDYEIDGNTFSFTFDLIDSNEICVGVIVVNVFLSTVSYSDYLNDDYEFPDITVYKKQYDAEVGDTISFNATMVDGNPEDYSWLWAFEGISTAQEGPVVSQKFVESGMFNGSIFVYEPTTGRYYNNTFRINISGSGSPGGSTKNEPGFEIVVFIAALVAALIIIRRKRRK